MNIGGNGSELCSLEYNLKNNTAGNKEGVNYIATEAENIQTSIFNSNVLCSSLNTGAQKNTQLNLPANNNNNTNTDSTTNTCTKIINIVDSFLAKCKETLKSGTSRLSQQSEFLKEGISNNINPFLITQEAISMAEESKSTNVISFSTYKEGLLNKIEFDDGTIWSNIGIATKTLLDDKKSRKDNTNFFKVLQEDIKEEVDLFIKPEQSKQENIFFPKLSLSAEKRGKNILSEKSEPKKQENNLSDTTKKDEIQTTKKPTKKAENGINTIKHKIISMGGKKETGVYKFQNKKNIIEFSQDKLLYNGVKYTFKNGKYVHGTSVLNLNDISNSIE